LLDCHPATSMQWKHMKKTFIEIFFCFWGVPKDTSLQRLLPFCHCEERSDEAILSSTASGLLPFDKRFLSLWKHSAQALSLQCRTLWLLQAIRFVLRQPMVMQRKHAKSNFHWN